MEKEEIDYIHNIIDTIREKRLKYWDKHYRFPDAIVLNNEILMNLKIYYLYLLGEKEIKTIFGMKLLIDNEIKTINDIEVFNIEEMKNNAV